MHKDCRNRLEPVALSHCWSSRSCAVCPFPSLHLNSKPFFGVIFSSNAELLIAQPVGGRWNVLFEIKILDPRSSKVCGSKKARKRCIIREIFLFLGTTTTSIIEFMEKTTYRVKLPSSTINGLSLKIVRSTWRSRKLAKSEKPVQSTSPKKERAIIRTGTSIGQIQTCQLFLRFSFIRGVDLNETGCGKIYIVQKLIPWPWRKP